MNSKTLLVLLSAVLLLGVAAWWTRSRQATDARESEIALFEGVERGRIRAFEIENVAHGERVRFERGADGVWVVTDPVRANADIALVDQVLGPALERRGTPVPLADSDPAKLGLEPPRSVLTLEELVDGTVRTQRAEFGEPDLDGDRVVVRVRGRLVRTWRDLATTLARNAEDFRSHQLLALDPRQILELERTGTFTLPDGRAIDANFAAFADGGAWRATTPVHAQLDPLGMSIWITALSRLGIASYVDFGTTPLANFGLDPPEVTLSIGTAAATLPLLRFGRVNHDRNADWLCSVAGDPHVYAIDPGAVGLLTAGVEDLPRLNFNNGAHVQFRLPQRSGESTGRIPHRQGPHRSEQREDVQHVHQSGLLAAQSHHREKHDQQDEREVETNGHAEQAHRAHRACDGSITRRGVVGRGHA